MINLFHVPDFARALYKNL